MSIRRKTQTAQAKGHPRALSLNAVLSVGAAPRPAAALVTQPDVGIRQNQLLGNKSFFGQDYVAFLVTSKETLDDTIQPIRQIVIRKLREQVDPSSTQNVNAVKDMLVLVFKFQVLRDTESEAVFALPASQKDGWDSIGRTLSLSGWKADTYFSERLKKAGINYSDDQPFGCEVFLLGGGGGGCPLGRDSHDANELNDKMATLIETLTSQTRNNDEEVYLLKQAVAELMERSEHSSGGGMEDQIAQLITVLNEQRQQNQALQQPGGMDPTALQQLLQTNKMMLEQLKELTKATREAPRATAPSGGGLAPPGLSGDVPTKQLLV